MEARLRIGRLQARTPALIATLFASASMPTPALAQATDPEDIVDAFHAALSTGDSTLALSFLSPEVVVFESGGAEMSREEYRSHHLGADIEFSMSTTREITERRLEAGGNVAIVLTRSSTTGTFRDRAIDSTGVETMVLTRREDGWVIVHIHWS